LLQVGLPDRFVEHGSREDCLQMAALDPGSVDRQVSAWWAEQRPARAARARRNAG
jgi:deoxyxylulose-5-phosphate synthase